MIAGPGQKVAGQNADQPLALGVVTHFGQGWELGLQAQAAALQAEVLRDGLNWTIGEPSPGRYVFTDRRTGFPGEIDDRFTQIVNFSYPNPNYDGGFTPHTDAGRQAQAAFVVAALDQFPDIDIIEIGNEFNAQNFVTGPVKTETYEQRDEYYFLMLKEIYERVKQRHPDVLVLGGATHSVPVAYLRDLFAHGGLDYMDGLAIHPYTSLPEQLADHLAILRAAMGDQAVPIHVTEFSRASPTPAEAAPYLVKMVTAMAASGIASASWYALLEQPYYQNMGLLDAGGAARPASRAFSFMQSILRGHGNPSDISPDRLTRIYQFGERAYVLWGIEREILAEDHVAAYDAQGRRLTMRPLHLDEDEPVVLIGDRPISIGAGFSLAPTDVVADSLFQFDVINDKAGLAGFEGPWSYFALNGVGRLDILHTRLGGDVQTEAWRPYIGHDWLRPLAVEPTSVNPVDFSDGQRPKDQYSIVERFTSAEAGTVDIEGTWQVASGSQDGIVLTVVADGEEIYRQTTRGALSLSLAGIAVEVGSTIDFIVGVNGNARGGDKTVRRIQILRSS